MTMPLPPAQIVRPAGSWHDACDSVTLDYEARFLRRKRLVTAQGDTFMVDLSETTSLNHGDALELLDGRLIEIIAAEEPLLQVTGRALPRLAWHIGNRHTPCQVEDARLLIRRDHVLADMLQKLGAELEEVTEQFLPEGGAYGHGRTMGHDHAHEKDQHHRRVHHHVVHHHTADDFDSGVGDDAD